MSIPVSPPPRDSTPRPSSSVVKSTSTTLDVDDKGNGKRGLQGEKTLGKQPVCGMIACSKCGESQNVAYLQGKVPEWIKCTGCGEIQPQLTYRAIGFGWPPLFTPTELRQMSQAK